jgi:hypothetical protein
LTAIASRGNDPRPPFEPTRRMLKLADQTPLAVGKLRYVYAHPDNANAVIKVLRPDVIATRWSGSKNWAKRIPRALHYTGYLREIKEYLAVRAAGAGDELPIARLGGLVDTDLGLGLVAERIGAPDGTLAPTLFRLLKAHGFQPWIAQGLDTLYAQLLRHRVILGDMHPGNVVYGSVGGGAPRFVVIDGFGEKYVLPLCSMSRRINRWHSARRYRRLIRKVHRYVAQLADGLVD